MHECGLSTRGRSYHYGVSYGSNSAPTVAIDVPLRGGAARKYRSVEFLRALNRNTPVKELRQLLPAKGTY